MLDIEKKKATVSVATAAILAASGVCAVANAQPASAAEDDGGSESAGNTQSGKVEITGEFIEPNEDRCTVDIDGDMKAESFDELNAWCQEQLEALDDGTTMLITDHPFESNYFLVGAGYTAHLEGTAGNAAGETMGVNEWTLLNDGCADQFVITPSEDGMSCDVTPMIKGAVAFMKHTWTYVDTVHTEIICVVSGGEGANDYGDDFEWGSDLTAYETVAGKETAIGGEPIRLESGSQGTIVIRGIDADMLDSDLVDVRSSNDQYFECNSQIGTDEETGEEALIVNYWANEAGKAHLMVVANDDTTADSAVYSFDVVVDRSTANDEETAADFYIATDFAYDETGGVAASTDGAYQEVGTGTVQMDPAYGVDTDGTPLLTMLYKEQFASALNEDGTADVELPDIEFDGKTLTYAADQSTDFMNTYSVDWEAMAVNAQGAMVDADVSGEEAGNYSADDGVAALANGEEGAAEGDAATDGEEAGVKVLGTAYISVMGNEAAEDGTAVPMVAYNGPYDGAAHTITELPFDPATATGVEYSADGATWTEDANAIAQTEVGTYTVYVRANTAPNVKTVWQYTIEITDAVAPAPASLPADTTSLAQTGDSGVAVAAGIAAGVAVVGAGAVVARKRLRRR